ncbi:MAG: winged helix-turn-helix transcriptional regulator [Thermoplasmata archaeon]
MAWSGPTTHKEPILPQIPFETCPIRASLGVLGRKWACLVLRDVAFFGDMSFTGLLRNNPGMTPRVLSMRLRDLRAEELIERVVGAEGPRTIRYRLTAKGGDAIPILTALIQYGMRHHADRVFEDQEPRSLSEVFPGRQDRMLGRLSGFVEAAETPRRGERVR